MAEIEIEDGILYVDTDDVGEITDGKLTMDIPLDVQLAEKLEEFQQENPDSSWKGDPVWTAKVIKKKGAAKKKTSAKKDAPAWPLITPKEGESQKSDDVVIGRHENDWDLFCKSYGVPPDTKPKPVEEILKDSDKRYPAKTSTVLTVKYFA